jgi:hypothetical protein
MSNLEFALPFTVRSFNDAIKFLEKVEDPNWSLHLLYIHVDNSLTCFCQSSRLSSIFFILFFSFFFYLKEKDSFGEP